MGIMQGILIIYSVAKKRRKSTIEEGMIAEQILGATKVNGEIHHLIKWYVPLATPKIPFFAEFI